jgi:hypothetical protein
MKFKDYIKIGFTILPLVFNSCDNSERFDKYKEKDGLLMHAWRDGRGNILSIQEKNVFGYLTAIDYFSSKDSLDGRFDQIKFTGVTKGSKLDKYANLDSLTALFNEVKETGSDKN